MTVRLDEDVVAWARAQAAQRNMTLSRYVGEMLREQMRTRDDYEEAMRRFLARGPFKELTGLPQRYPRRDELYGRASRPRRMR